MKDERAATKKKDIVFSVKINMPLRNRIRQEAKKHDLSSSAYIRLLVNKYLGRKL